MDKLLIEAKKILSGNRTDQAARNFMTPEQRNALAADFAAKKQFLSASHFATDAEQTKEFERMFWDSLKLKGD